MRVRTGQDIRTIGSNSAGAKNVGRILGRWGFATTLAGDMLKGALVIFIAKYADVSEPVLSAILLAVVLGHIYPMQLGFRGGKGVGTAGGGLIAYDFPLTVCLWISFGLCLLMMRNSVLSAIFVFLVSPIIAIALVRNHSEILGLVLLAMLISFSHRKNLAEQLRLQYKKPV